MPCPFLVRTLKIHHSNWKIIIALSGDDYLKRLEDKIRKCSFFYVKIFWNNSVCWLYVQIRGKKRNLSVKYVFTSRFGNSEKKVVHCRMFKAILHVGKLMWHYYFGVDSICTYVHSSAFQSMSVSNNNRVQPAFLNCA